MPKVLALVVAALVPSGSIGDGLRRDWWSDNEARVWELVRGGFPADFLSDSQLDAKVELKGEFLEEILIADELRDSVTPWGIRIYGATVKGDVFLENVDVNCALWLENCEFKGAVSLSQAKSSGVISFAGSRFRKELRLNGIRMDSSLFLDRVSAPVVMLLGARLGDSLFLEGASIDELLLDRTRVEMDVVVRKLEGGVRPRFEQLSFDGGRVSGRVILENVDVKELDLAGISIKDDLSLRGTRIDLPLRLRDSNIGGSVLVASCALSSIDLAGVRIERELRFNARGELTQKGAQMGNQWTPGRESTLANASVKSIVLSDLSHWPPRIDLRGLTYETLITAPEKESPVDREALVLEWIGRSRPVALSPYRYVSARFESSGDRAMARHVLYQGLESDRRQAWERVSASSPEELGYWLWRTGAWLVVGHGLRLFQVIAWYAALIIAGTLALWVSGEARRHRLGTGIWFSIDLALPIVKLRDYHHERDLADGVRHYFYIHQVLGYVLATYLIAGLSGLVQ